MTQDELVVVKIGDLTALIRKEISEALSAYVQPPKADTPEKFGIDEAVIFLNDLGFKTSKSFLQKLCAKSAIPFSKMCGKCIFSAKDLTDFVEKKEIKKGAR